MYCLIIEDIIIGTASPVSDKKNNLRVTKQAKEAASCCFFYHRTEIKTIILAAKTEVLLQEYIRGRRHLN